MRLSWLMPVLVCLSPPLVAQEPGPPLPRIELNRVDALDGACRLWLVAENPGATGIDALTVEAVLFDRAGRVATLSLLDLGALPAGRMRVRPFDLAGVACGDLGRLLINAASCQPEGACAAGLDWTSATDIAVRP